MSEPVVEPDEENAEVREDGDSADLPPDETTEVVEESTEETEEEESSEPKPD